MGGGNIFGGSKSKIETQSTTEIVTNVLMSDIQDCPTFMKSVQVQAQIGEGNIMIGGQQTAALQVNANCFASSQKMAEVQNELIQTLLQKAETSSSGFALDTAKSKITSDIVTSVQNNITQSFIQNCITSANAMQTQIQIGGGNYAKDLQQKTTMEAVRECVMNSESVSNIASSLDQHWDIQASAENRNPFAEILDSLGGILSGFLWVIVIAFMILLGFFGWFFSGEEGAQRVQNVAMAAEVAKKTASPI